MMMPVVTPSNSSFKRRLLGLGVAVIAAALVFWAYRSHVASKAAGGPAANVSGKFGPGRRHTGHAQGRSGANGADPAAAGELVLVRGTVVDAETAEAVGGGEVVFSDGRTEKTTRADGNGRYQIEVHPGSYRPFVRGDDVVSVGAPARERLVQTPTARLAGVAHDDLAPLVVIHDDEAGVDLRVERSAKLTGKVANRNGDPVPGAIVRARGSKRPIGGTDIAETAADGSFTLQLPFGGYYIDASHEEYAGIDASQTNVNVQPGVRPEPLNLTLVAGCIVHGKVVGPTGMPIGEGSVDHRGPEMSDFRPSSSIEPDGTFRFTTVVEGDVALRAWPWMSPPTTPETVHCGEGARPEVTLRLADDGKPDLDGTVTTADGQPAAGAYLDIVALTPGGENQEERADGEGKWEVYALPAGVYQVSVTVAGEGSVQRRVTVPSHDVGLTLGGIGSITGTVLGVGDGSLAMTVSGCAGDLGAVSPSPRLVAVHDGKFRIDGVPACSVTLGAEKSPRSSVTEVSVVAKRTSDATLDLAPPPANLPDLAPEPPAPEPVAIDVPFNGPAAPPEDLASGDAPDDGVGGGDPGDAVGD